MKKYAAMLVAIAFILGLTGAAKAESQDGVIVTLPFEFVVGAKTLPAGTYIVRNLTDDLSGAIEISSQNYSTSMFVLPYVSEIAVTGKPELSFERVGDQHFLSTIQTAATVYRVHVSDSSVNESLAKFSDSAPSSVSHGGK
jgi:hypothetical protein